jgi:4-hydroxy-tetrahydrodipicolinate synthase
VAEAVDLPMILYNIPARAGNALAPETVGRLAEIPNIVGAKDSSGNFDNLLAYIEQTRFRKDFRILSGNDSLILPTLKAGGAGGIAGCANVVSQKTCGDLRGLLSGRPGRGAAPAGRDADFRACFRYGNPNTVVKTAVNLLGYPVGQCAGPSGRFPTRDWPRCARRSRTPRRKACADGKTDSGRYPGRPAGIGPELP